MLFRKNLIKVYFGGCVKTEEPKSVCYLPILFKTFTFGAFRRSSGNFLSKKKVRIPISLSIRYNISHDNLKALMFYLDCAKLHTYCCLEKNIFLALLPCLSVCVYVCVSISPGEERKLCFCFKGKKH